MERLRRFVRRVAWRLGFQALLDAACGWLAAGASTAAALVLAERVLSLGVNPGLLAVVPLVAAGIGGLAVGASRWPGPLAAAMSADARLGLHERLSTALVAGEGPMAEMVRADAEHRAAALDPRRAFPIRPPARLPWLLMAIAGLGAAALVPPVDLLGWGAARAARAAERAAVRRATDAARVGLGKLAGLSRDAGLDRATRTLERMEQELAALAASEPTAAQAREAAKRMADGLNEAKAANAASLGQAPDPKERSRAETERDLLASTERILDGFQRELASEASAGTIPASGKVPDAKKGSEGERSQAQQFVRAQEPPPVPRESAKLESRLIATRPAAEAVMRRHDIPWRYRTIVQRYFSPDE